MTTVAYEDVVADTEKEAKRLIEFLGLEWDKKCLEFHKSDRPVKTASVAQVRKPIYNTAVKRWKKYGDGLQPLVDAIEGKSAGKPSASRKPKAKAEGQEILQSPAGRACTRRIELDSAAGMPCTRH